MWVVGLKPLGKTTGFLFQFPGRKGMHVLWYMSRSIWWCWSWSLRRILHYQKY